MKLNKTLLTSIAVLGFFAFAKAQISEECSIMLQLYAENAKAKNYDEAYKDLNPLIAKCPDASAAIYQYGAIIYEHRLDNNVGDLMENAKGLIAMLQAQIDKFPTMIDVPRKKIEIARTTYKYKIGTITYEFNMFNDLFKEDPEHFTDPNAMITYFTLAKQEYDDNHLTLKQLFDIYDALSEKINTELDTRLAQVEKLESILETTPLTEDQSLSLENEKINISNYGIVSGSLTSTIGKLVGCDYLVPLYESEFEAHKTDEAWLSGVLNRLQYKDCTDAPVYLKAVKALHVIKPSARTAYGLGAIAATQQEKFKYWDEALALGVTKDLEAKIHYEKGNAFKSKGQYGQAKAEYLKAVNLRPSYGIAYLKIANMIADSAQNCGGDPFSQRAVYWVAARWAEKAANADRAVRSNANQYAANYRAKAPSTQDIFSSTTYKKGSTIRIGCWINESVVIP